MRQVKEYVTDAGELRFRVRYRSGVTETSETFLRRADAEMFAGIMGDGRNGRTAEALAWLVAKQNDAESATFGQWFETHLGQLTGITSRTRADYRSLHRRYLTGLDPLPLSLVTRTDITRIVQRLEADGLAPKTIKNVLHMLSSVFAHAMDEGLVSRNPTRRIRINKQRHIEAEAVQFLTYEEVAELVEATDPHYQPLVTFLFGTGLRWSEATALQARHIDLEHGTVRVQRAWKRIPGGWEIGPPKSDKSKRTVNAAVPALVAVADLLGKPSDLVFTTPRGNVVRHSNFYNRIWVPACERAGFDPRPTPHTARHTFASWLISEGIGLEAVQDQLGHESYETTRKTYAMLLPAVGVAAGKAASSAMGQVLAHRAELRRLALQAAGHPDQPADAAHEHLDVDDDRQARGEQAGGNE